MKKRLFSAAENVLRNCLKIRTGERVLIITDILRYNIGQIFFQVASKFGEPILVEMLPGKMHGEEPPSIISRMLKEWDVFIIPTTMSLTHTRARRDACRLGKRGATLPGITEDMMARTLNADYKKIAKLSLKLAHLLTAARQAHLITKKGTNLRLKLGNRSGHPDTGIIHNRGDFSNLPAGEAYIAPVEGSAQGSLVIDGSMAPMGRLKNDLIFIIKDGKIKSITNDRGYFVRIFNKYGPESTNLAELGIGTNDFARITGEVLEDEKVMGTVHIAFGSNFAFGGKVSVPIHLDGVINQPTLFLDDKCIMRDGRFII
ncbi:MAG: aminopeptidase [candidate division WOR-3 bacterium]